MVVNKIANLKCLAYDFDGVMTNNKVLVREDGIESVVCNRSDGLAISYFREMGMKQIIISTEKNRIVHARARKLKIDVVQGVKDKGIILEKYCKNQGVDLSAVMYFGNDLNDIPAFRIVGVSGAPADAEKEVLSMADWISDYNGGDGVIRDFYRLFIGLHNDNMMKNGLML